MNLDKVGLFFSFLLNDNIRRIIKSNFEFRIRNANIISFIIWVLLGVHCGSINDIFLIKFLATGNLLQFLQFQFCELLTSLFLFFITSNYLIVVFLYYFPTSFQFNNNSTFSFQIIVSEKMFVYLKSFFLNIGFSWCDHIIFFLRLFFIIFRFKFKFIV